MKRSIATVLAAVLACLASIGASDALRVVSLDLCTDWMLAKYASRSQVAALSPFVHRYPVDWLDANQWPSHNGSLEQILLLTPDLVITGEYNALTMRKRLQQLGVRVEILPLPQSIEEIDNYEQRFRQLLELPTLKKTSSINSESSGDQRLLLLGANGIGTGRETFEDDLMRRAGWRNYLETSGYIPLDLEQVVADPPDAILWAAPKNAALANRFAEHPALKKALSQGRWLHTDYWRWQCPGPWTRRLINELAQWHD